MDIKKIIRSAVLVILLIPGIAFAGSQQTSTTLASAIITNARYYLNEPSERFWSDIELLAYLNDGSIDIVARTHCLEATEVEVLVTDQLAYSLGDSFIVIKAVVYDDIKALRRGRIESLGDVLGTSGEPVYWTQWGDDVLVYPVPDATANGNNIEVYTITRPAAVASGAAVLVPAHFDRALTLYIVSQALKKDRRYAESNAVLAEYLSELDRFRADFSYQPVKQQID